MTDPEHVFISVSQSLIAAIPQALAFARFTVNPESGGVEVHYALDAGYSSHDFDSVSEAASEASIPFDFIVEWAQYIGDEVPSARTGTDWHYVYVRPDFISLVTRDLAWWRNAEPYQRAYSCGACLQTALLGRAPVALYATDRCTLWWQDGEEGHRRVIQLSERLRAQVPTVEFQILPASDFVRFEAGCMLFERACE